MGRLSTDQGAGGSAGVFEAIGADRRAVVRLARGRNEQPSATILDSHNLQSSPESGHRAGYDGAKPCLGSKVHLAVDTLGHLLALQVTPANEQDRAQVAHLAEQVQEATGASVEVAFVDQGYAGEQRRMMPLRTSCVWKWSSCRRPRKASCCCREASWSSAPLTGLAATEV